jgi:4'-phosphopantetheinyl transferase
MAPPPANLVDIWLAEPRAINDPELLAAYERLLSDGERERQRAFVFDKNRREYLVAHALVRSTLSKYAATRPSEWRFSKNAYGRPAIEPPSALRFNLSHHPTMVVCAVSTGAELGVDVEPLQRGDEILEIADATFAPSELADLRTLPDAIARDRAVSLWTLKEAYIKARGLGLALPLGGFAFSFDEPRPPRVSFGPTIADQPERWAFRTRDVNGHRIALAVERNQAEPEIRLHFNVPLSTSVTERF